jgi:hypothetical protein
MIYKFKILLNGLKNVKTNKTILTVNIFSHNLTTKHHGLHLYLRTRFYLITANYINLKKSHSQNPLPVLQDKQHNN